MICPFCGQALPMVIADATARLTELIATQKQICYPDARDKSAMKVMLHLAEHAFQSARRP